MHAVAAVAATFAAIFEPELVQLYEPSVPTLTAARTGCPHTTGALLDWHDAWALAFCSQRVALFFA